jgi:hypothetical protein
VLLLQNTSATAVLLDFCAGGSTASEYSDGTGIILPATTGLREVWGRLWYPQGVWARHEGEASVSVHVQWRRA